MKSINALILFIALVKCNLTPKLYTCANNNAYRLYKKTSVACANVPDAILDSMFNQTRFPKKSFSLGVIFKDFHNDNQEKLIKPEPLHKSFEEQHRLCDSFNDAVDAGNDYHPRLVPHVRCQPRTFHTMELQCRPVKNTVILLKRTDLCIESKSLIDLGYRFDDSNHPFVEFWEVKAVASSYKCSGYYEATYELANKWTTYHYTELERQQQQNRICSLENKNDCCQINHIAFR